jgi:hypothetical protein
MLKKPETGKAAAAGRKYFETNHEADNLPEVGLYKLHAFDPSTA